MDSGFDLSFPVETASVQQGSIEACSTGGEHAFLFGRMMWPTDQRPVAADALVYAISRSN
jgi:hypothetical protein